MNKSLINLKQMIILTRLDSKKNLHRYSPLTYNVCYFNIECTMCKKSFILNYYPKHSNIYRLLSSKFCNKISNALCNKILEKQIFNRIICAINC